MIAIISGITSIYSLYHSVLLEMVLLLFVYLVLCDKDNFYDIDIYNNSSTM